MNSIFRTVKWVSGLGISSMDLTISDESQLRLLANQGNLSELATVCRRSSVFIDRLYCAFIPSWIFTRDKDSLERAWSKISSVAAALETTVIEMLSPAFPLGKEVTEPNRSGFELEWLDAGFSWNKVWTKYVATTKQMSRLAEKSDLLLAVEPRPRELLCGTDSLLRLFDEAGSEHLGAVMDISHAYTVREIPALSIRKLEKKIFSVHLSDTDGITEWHWAPGQGQIEWLPVLKALKAIQYSGVLSLDVSGADIEGEVIEGKKFIENLLEMI